jgi:hypothetical protein
VDRTPSFEEGLLDKVPRIMLIAHNGVDRCEDPGTIFGYEFAEGFRISGL